MDSTVMLSWTNGDYLLRVSVMPQETGQQPSHPVEIAASSSSGPETRAKKRQKQDEIVAAEALIKLVEQNEDLYEQKPVEAPAPIASPSSNALPVGSYFPSRFEHVENNNTLDKRSEGNHVVSHVAPPKSSSFVADFGMDSGFQKKGSSNSSKVQGSNSITSADAFGHDSDNAALDISAQPDLSSLKNIAGETGKKLWYLGLIVDD